MVAEVVAIGEDDVIHEVDAHQFAGLLQLSSQVVVVLAGTQVARRMIVTDRNDGSIGQYRFTHNDTNIDGCLCNAAMRDTYLFDKTTVDACGCKS